MCFFVIIEKRITPQIEGKRFEPRLFLGVDDYLVAFQFGNDIEPFLGLR
jgi:hypothetical protein